MGDSIYDNRGGYGTVLSQNEESRINDSMTSLTGFTRRPPEPT